MIDKIGKEKIINKAFEGRNDVIKWDIQKISNGQNIKITFISKNSPKKQGIRLATDNGIEVNGQLYTSIQLWDDTSPKEVICKCYTKDECLSIYNMWDKGNGAQSQSHTSGMIVVENDNILTYNCNDIGFDTNFDKLIFTLEKLD
ncbi:hypothetical protein CSC2_08280 [Clostridium zeae]|uniref:Uncharacterized protein n=1 Tax=Clostridium zeae TaxID=2759022 RepID=A0ABQ1E6A2_9CLOT|nr:hypothetical protein [Clostridium zeae]GFZ30302.1 hypothetical protein CSC2_08280 [Clostridium zeae]